MEVSTKKAKRPALACARRLKLLKAQLAAAQAAGDDGGASFNPQSLTVALCRNFGGKQELMSHILEVFHRRCFEAEAPTRLPSVRLLLRANLEDAHARHLMVLTHNGAALPLMFGCGLLDELKTTVLVGSEFDDDRSELYLVHQINQVKIAMARHWAPGQGVWACQEEHSF